jgi:hypothetical protein
MPEGSLMPQWEDLPLMLSPVLVVLILIIGALRWFATRLLADIDTRLRRIDDIERRLDRLAADLPIHYVRREDHIREITALGVKLDRIYECLMRIRNV